MTELEDWQGLSETAEAREATEAAEGRETAWPQRRRGKTCADMSRA